MLVGTIAILAMLQPTSGDAARSTVRAFCEIETSAPFMLWYLHENKSAGQSSKARIHPF